MAEVFLKECLVISPAPMSHMQSQAPGISLAGMRSQVDAGRAQPLFDIPDGPVRFAGNWWIVPKSAPQRGYVPVDDPKIDAMLSDAARRVDSPAADA